MLRLVALTVLALCTAVPGAAQADVLFTVDDFIFSTANPSGDVWGGQTYNPDDRSFSPRGLAERGRQPGLVP